MKKMILILLTVSFLTACSKKNESSEKFASNSEAEISAVQVTENIAETYKEDENICAWENNDVIFENVNEFEEYLNSEEHDVNSSIQSKSRNLTYSNETDTKEILTPTYDESKYEITKILYQETSYSYYFKNLLTDNNIKLCIFTDTSYHNFNEMYDYANENLVTEVENIKTTVWGDTSALLQTVPFSNPVYYSIQAMIDENNSVFISDEDLSPEELTACLNDFTFE